MKDLHVEWVAETLWEMELSVKGCPAEQPNETSRLEPGKATKRIIITESGAVLRQCVRAMQ